MNYRKLKGRIIEKYGTMSAFADAIGESKQCVSRLIRLKRLSTLTISKWAKALDICVEDIGPYFFT